MDTGFYKISSISPVFSVADIDKNKQIILNSIENAVSNNVQILTLPELALTTASLGDLFLQNTLIHACEKAIAEIVDATKKNNLLLCFGAPIFWRQAVYDVALCIQSGKILAAFPKTEFSQSVPSLRSFSAYKQSTSSITICGQTVPFGASILELGPKASVGVLFYDELIDSTLLTQLSQSGANILLCLSAQPHLVTEKTFIDSLLQAESARHHAIIAYASAGIGESSTDYVYSGYTAIYENGHLLQNSDLFELDGSVSTADVDIDRCLFDRAKKAISLNEMESIPKMDAETKSLSAEKISRRFPPLVFIPEDKNYQKQYAEEILTMQTVALVKRMQHIGISKIVLGLSGGLDSTLAFLVAIRALKRCDLPLTNLHCITLPGFGTTDRTYQNALSLSKEYGVTLSEISIADATIQHFKDIRHAVENKNTTYENAQARERTQILMDVANDENAILLGTGDLSELALGWCTFNADHMSMYGVNADVPKTLVQHLVAYEAEQAPQSVQTILEDILSTPISPELLPPEKDGKIHQKTENTLGPYEVHDFFLYYFLRFGFSTDKLLLMAQIAFKEKYAQSKLENWLHIFMKRFFQNQFKRSCLPDGPKIGTVGLSPRGDLFMPSDASSSAFLKF